MGVVMPVAVENIDEGAGDKGVRYCWDEGGVVKIEKGDDGEMGGRVCANVAVEDCDGGGGGGAAAAGFLIAGRCLQICSPLWFSSYPRGCFHALCSPWSFVLLCLQVPWLGCRFLLLRCRLGDVVPRSHG